MSDRHGTWANCSRCNATGMISRAPAFGGLLCVTNGIVLCWNGHECLLRLKRRRRKQP